MAGKRSHKQPDATVRVLCVEDSADDTELMMRELRQAGLVPTYTRVQSAEQLQAALAESQWDVAIVDYNLPGFDGVEAIRLLHLDDPDLPAILASGVIDETTAVTTMTAGAADFVLKSNLTRLAPAVCREVEEVRRKRAAHVTDQALKDSEIRFRTLVENMNDVVFSLDLDGAFTYISPVIEKEAGWDPKELIGRHPVELSSQDDVTEFAQALKEAAEGVSLAHTFRVPDKWGAVRHLRTSLRPLFQDGRLVGFTGIGTNITDLVHAAEERERATEQLANVLRATVATMASFLERRDPYTAGHQVKVAQLVARVAARLELPEHDAEGVVMAAMMHDIGKISVPAEILSKPGKLSEMEYGIVKMHAEAGHEMLGTIDWPWPVAEAVRQHHERLDGSGYPDGLSGDQIGRAARILAVADVVEAMSSHRPYRSAFSVEVALAEIEAGRGVRFDPDVVDACLAVFREEAFTFSEPDETA